MLAKESVIPAMKSSKRTTTYPTHSRSPAAHPFGARAGTGCPTRRHDNAVPHSSARLRRGPLVDIHSHRSALNLPSVVLAGSLLRFVVVVEGRSAGAFNIARWDFEMITFQIRLSLKMREMLCGISMGFSEFLRNSIC